jgi:hypothetical protein
MEYVYPSKSVHITRKDLGKKVVLRPSKSYSPVGVSFAPTVKKALEAVPIYHNRHGKEKLRPEDWQERKKWANKSSEWNVYTPIRKRKAVIPSTIDDFHRTGERRVLNKVEAKKIGRIKVRVSGNKWVYKWI